MNSKNLWKIGMLSIVVLVAQMILTYGIYPIIGKSTQTIFSIDQTINPVSGIGGQQVGDKVLGYLSGYISFDITNIWIWVSMFIGIFALLSAGMFIYDKMPRKFQGKNLPQRLFAILLYGHAVLYGILFFLKMNVPGIAINLLIGLGINLMLISGLIYLSVTKLGFPKI
jgi:hypothetical protein